MTEMHGSSSGGNSVDLKVQTLQDLMKHSDSDIAQAANQAAQRLHDVQTHQPIQEVLDCLVEQRDNLPNKDPLLSALDKAIIPLTLLFRKMFAGGPYDISWESAPAPPSPSPGSPAGHILQDLNESNLLHEASDLLGIKHLSKADGPVAWPVHGVLYGPYQRPLICLPTAIGSRPYKNIIYLVDTGAPITELSPRAFKAIGVGEMVPRAAFVSINGSRHKVCLCVPTGSHADIPVLGADSMKALGLTLIIDYKTGTVTLEA